MRLSYLSTRSTVSVRVMEKQGEKSIACSLTTHLLQNQKLPREERERTGLPSSLSPLLPTYSRRMYTYIYIYIYIRTHERSTRYTRLLAAPLLPRYEQFAHVCDARFSFILGRNAEWQKRAQVVSLPRSANESLRFWISPLVQQTQVIYIYRSIFPFFSFYLDNGRR